MGSLGLLSTLELRTNLQSGNDHFRPKADTQKTIIMAIKSFLELTVGENTLKI